MRPMLAVAGALPEGAGWSYEMKWDGVRALADVTAEGLRMTSRSGSEVTVAYPELHGLAEVAEDVLLDGEVVAFADNRPSFAALQPRMHVRNAAHARRLAETTPVTYLIFDVLRLYGVDLTDRPYAERRATLDRLDLGGERWTVPPTFDDGPATVAACRTQGLEGVVAKRLAAPYRPGVRSPEWVKVRLLRRQEFVVAGWQRGSGGRRGSIGALVLGYHRDGDLVYAGQVGSGFTDAALDLLADRLLPLQRERPPFAAPPPTADQRDVVWCDPQVVVEVEFGEWTPNGRLRFPTYQGLRDDKNPDEVVRE